MDLDVRNNIILLVHKCILHRVHHLEGPSWLTHRLKRRIMLTQYILNGLQSEGIKELLQMKNAYDAPNTLLNMLAAKTWNNETTIV